MKISIFDLDNTLVNTEILKRYRDNGQWSYVFSNIALTETTNKTLEILEEAKDGKIIIVTSSPRNYAQAVLEHHRITYDGLIAYHDVIKKKPDPEGYIKAITPDIDTLSEIFIYGDEEKDFVAADSLKNFLQEQNKNITIKKIGCIFYKNNNLKNIDSIRR